MDEHYFLGGKKLKQDTKADVLQVMPSVPFIK